MIHGIKEQDLVSKGVLTPSELKFLEGLKIPLYDAADLWREKDRLDTIIINAIEARIVEKPAPVFNKLPSIYVISDDLGINGVSNPVNGKRYDSKSQYYKDVKASGMEIVGNDAPITTRKEIKGNYDCHRDVAQAIEQTGAMEKLTKRKKK